LLAAAQAGDLLHVDAAVRWLVPKSSAPALKAKTLELATILRASGLDLSLADPGAGWSVRDQLPDRTGVVSDRRQS
jgi:hypothetical protein